MQSTVQTLNRIYFMGVRELARQDVRTAQIQTGLTRRTLEMLRDAPLDSVDKAIQASSTLVFKPQIHGKQLARWLDEPEEVNDYAVLQGVRANADASD